MKLRVDAVVEVPSEFCGEKCTPLLENKHIVTVFRNTTTIGVWETGTTCKRRSSLIGHDKKVTALCISPSNERYLCSCSADKVFLWDLNVVSSTDHQESSLQGILVAVDLGFISHCEFSWDKKWLAVCNGKEILVIHLQFSYDDDGAETINGVSIYTSIAAGSSLWNMCAFSPQQKGMLVCVEDKHFKIWNVETRNLIHQSLSFGVQSLTFCKFDTKTTKLLIGSNKGMVYVYNTATIDRSGPWNVLTTDVGKTFMQNTALGGMDPEIPFKEGGDCVCEANCIVFAVKLYTREKSSVKTEEDFPISLFDEDNLQSNYKLVVSPGSVLVVCCNFGIALYDCKSTECLICCHYFDLIQDTSLWLVDFVVLGGESLGALRCLIKDSSFDHCLRIYSLSVEGEESEVHTKATVFSNAPLALKCPLRSQLLTKQALAYDPASRRNDRTMRQSKSSGYGKQHCRTMFTPVLNHSKQTVTTKSKPIYFETSENMVKKFGLEKVSQCNPMSVQRDKIRVWDTHGTDVTLASSGEWKYTLCHYSWIVNCRKGDGQHLACGSSLSDICILQFYKLDVKKSINLVGHNAAINSLDFSFNSRWLVSTSGDATAKVWDWTRKKCLISINKPIPERSKGQLRKNIELQGTRADGPISAARFYYMDQFILASSGSFIQLYGHTLNEPKTNKDKNQRCKKVHEVQVPAKQVTCFTAANQFHSYIVLCGCSNKCVQVFDINAQKFCLEIKDVHSRPLHQIKQMSGSRHHSLQTPMYDLFLTSSICDGAKLWDLRSAKCVQMLSKHVSRTYACGVDVSPCGRYIAAGSEDNTVYVYDTRKCEDFLGKLKGLGDVVMDVVFNPVLPILAASSLNGDLATFHATHEIWSTN